jgi:cell division septation protein DedD
MKLICPKCQYTGLVDATDEGVLCARCGASMDQLLWSGSPASTLTTATAAAIAVAPQRLMENQNAYAPSAETGFDDVLEIPSPTRAAEPTAEQMLVLEDVIPEQELHAADYVIEPHVTATDEGTNALTLPGQGVHKASPEATALAVEDHSLAGGPPQVYGGTQTSSFDYEGGRVWLRVAPLLLLIGAVVFFALYYLGNRISLGGRSQETAATSPTVLPETQSAAPTQAPAESASPARQAADAPAQTAARQETEPPVEKPAAEAPKAEPPKTEPPRQESKPPATVAATAAPVPPVASQATGNFTVQVGSYNNSAQADERAGRLRSSGVEARVVQALIPGRGTWYRVQAGRFSSHEDAARYAAELKGKGATDSFLITDFQGQ